jgi:hypothetical protein
MELFLLIFFTDACFFYIIYKAKNKQRQKVTIETVFVRVLGGLKWFLKIDTLL